MSDSGEKNLEQEVIAAQERAAAVGKQLDEIKTSLREGKSLPVSGQPISWESLKARIEALTTPDEVARKLLEEVVRLANQTSQRVTDLEQK